MPRVVEAPEAQRVHERDRPRADREDVADDPADPRRSTLVGLDGRRVVVALDADGDREPVADVDDARTLARPHEHPGRLGREAPEVRLRRLVRAVLRPHHRVHGELELGRLPLEQPHDRVQLVVRQPQSAVQWLGLRRHGPEATDSAAGTLRRR